MLKSEVELWCVQGRRQGQHRAGRERGAEERAEGVRRRARVLPRGEFAGRDGARQVFDVFSPLVGG
jgi:hypothetical protein